MTMEQNNSNNNNNKIVKQKKSFSKFLLPNKIPNKIGIASSMVNRSQSAREQTTTGNNGLVINSAEPKITIVSKRPLSLNISNMRTNNSSKISQTHRRDPPSLLTRCSSISEHNVATGDAAAAAPFDDAEFALLREKSVSHESVLKDVQYLQQIPTAKARQRNYLQGRIGTNSLLGPTELDRMLPHRQITIFVGTWNMNGHTPPKYILLVNCDF